MSDTEAAPQNPAFEVRRGHPSDEELAALIAVVGAAYAEESAMGDTEPAATRSRWLLSARGLRSPLPRERGWGGFGG